MNTDTKLKNIIEDLLTDKKYEEAFDYLKKVSDAGCYLTAGDYFVAKSRRDLAEKFYLKALEINPKDTNVLSTLGSYYFNEKKFDTSEHYHKISLALEPDNPKSLCDIASIERQKGNFQGAKVLYEKIFSLGKENEFVYANMGILYLFLHDIQKGKEYLEKALEINPDNKVINFYNSFALFKSGDFSNAFKCYEGREWFKRPPGTEWDGSSGKKLLVMPEQGYGDMIQFARYFKEAKSISDKIIFLCPKELFRLFETIENIDEIVEFNANDSIDLVDYSESEIDGSEDALYDGYARIMSLPYMLNIDVEKQNFDDKLFNIDELSIKKWEKVFSGNKKKIGLCWNSRLQSAQPRHIPLKELASIFTLDNCDFYSLQKNDNEQLEHYPFVKDYADQFEDFYETASFIMNLDLIITIDTSIAHLAASLNKKTFLLVNDWSCWRWSNKSTTFWYPSVEIFRQSKGGDWTDVVKQVFDKLKEE